MAVAGKYFWADGANYGPVIWWAEVTIVDRRRKIVQSIGRAIYKSGGRVGRKPFRADRVPNLRNYRGIMAGMKRQIRIVKPSKKK